MLLGNFQKTCKSGSTMAYEACQAFNHTFGAREGYELLHISVQN